MAIDYLKKCVSDFSRRALAAFILGTFAISPAFADTYEILTWENGTVTGMGSIDTGNTGVSYSTNANSAIGIRTFSNTGPTPLTIQFLDVDYFDGKPENNHIVGNFAEGLIGTLRSETTSSPPRYYLITFDETTAPTATNQNPTKTCSIQAYNSNNNNPVNPPIVCRYSLTNVTNGVIPEPPAVILFSVGLLACWLVVRRKRPAA